MTSILTPAGWVVEPDVVDERKDLPRLTGVQIAIINARIAVGSNEFPIGTQVIRSDDQVVMVLQGLGIAAQFVVPTTDLSGLPTKTELSAASGLTTIGYVAPFTGATPRSASDKASERKSVLDDGAPVDGVTPAHTALQKMATRVDTEKARYFYIPNWKEDFLIGAPLVFNNPGVRIFGDQGATYNRNAIKTGFLKALAGIARILDLGNFRTTGNPADNWNLEGLSLCLAPGVAARSVDGIGFTSRTDGPDRGASLRSLSLIGLKHAITIENPDVSTGLATLALQDSVITDCVAVLVAKGNLLGFSMRNCQVEQNVGGPEGLIQGSINGASVVENCMLEGQTPFMSVDIPPITGNRPHVVNRYNYLEANTGDYYLRVRTSSAQATFEVGPNYVFNFLGKDYLLFEGGAGAWFGTIKDEFPIVFKKTDARIRYGSSIFFGRVREYGIRQLGTQSPEIVLSDFQNLTDPDDSHTHVQAPAGTSKMTPYGMKPVVTGQTFLDVPLACAAGDLINLCLLCNVWEVTAGSVIIQVYNQNTSAQVAEFGPSGVAVESMGRWCLVCRPFRAATAATSLRVRMFATGDYKRAIAGITAKNYGAFPDDGVNKVLVMPVTPNIA